MYPKKRILSKIQSEYILIGILYLIGLLCLYRDDDKKRGRPYVYPTTVILRCHVVRIWMRIPSNNCLHQYLSTDMPYNQKVRRACGLHTLPDRRTFDRRFKVLPICSMISIMGQRFVSESLVDSKIVAIDSTTIHARGPVWHHVHIKKGIIPRTGIDTDARWGFARTKGWIFGYKIHVVSSTGKLVVPLSSCTSTANVYDNQLYCNIIEQLPDGMRYVVADGGYDDWKLHDYTRRRGMGLVCPIRRYRHTKGDRLELIRFYKSKLGQRIYRNRSVSVEPLFQCIKDTFCISTVPVQGFDNVSSYLLMCVLVYQLSVYYNCVTDSTNPRCVKHMLGN